jgi:hypothetical protein
MRMALLALLLQPCHAFAADAVYSGSLERVGQESISIRLADRRLIDARLPNTRLLSAGKIAAQYDVGDQVEITCRPIKPVWEEDTSRYQFLELTKLRFLRASPKPAASAPAPLTKEEVLDAAVHSKLEHAREVNLESASNMPNFVADETAKRYTSDGKSQQWRYLDTIETEITFTGNRAVRQRIRRDGRPWTRPFEALPGFKWYGGFGTELQPLFDLQCPTTIDFEGRAELHGKQVLKYRFSSPPDGCFGSFYFEYQRYNPARTGRIFIEDVVDGRGGNVIQLDEEASGFPAAFDFAQRNEEVSWDYVRIADAPHLLPVAANFVVFYSSGKRSRVEVQYKNHRHFETATDITFH